MDGIIFRTMYCLRVCPAAFLPLGLALGYLEFVADILSILVSYAFVWLMFVRYITRYLFHLVFPLRLARECNAIEYYNM